MTKIPKEGWIGILTAVIISMIIIYVYVVESDNEKNIVSSNEPKEYCVSLSNGRVCYSSPEHAEQLHFNGQDIWVTENDSTGERVHYIEYNGSKYFYDSDEVEKNHSVYPVFGNGKERIVIKGNRFPEGDTIERYVPPYTANLSIKYDVEKIVFSPDFLIYYWNNNTLTTLVSTGNDVVTTVRSYDNRLILVKEYRDNYMTIKYWQLNISKRSDMK